ncbi:MAG: DUF4388 domain-containing protein [Calditrichia bacterium]
MASQNILIIEPDLSFAQKLSSELQKLGFSTIFRTDILDPDELLNTTALIHSIILNLELKNTEGITLYSFLKNQKNFKETTFSFLADDHDVFQLMKNMPLERAVVINKEEDFNEIISQILNSIPAMFGTSTEHQFMTEACGELGDISLNEILSFCDKTCFTGNLLLTHDQDFSVIHFENGTFKELNYKDYEMTEAFTLFQSWNRGSFRLERKRYTVEEIRKLAKAADNETGPLEDLPISYKDLFIDVFNFLTNHLSEQLSDYQLRRVYSESLEIFKSRHPFLKDFLFLPENEDKIDIKFEISAGNIEVLIDLFKQIFFNAKRYESELALNDIFLSLHELEPYLNRIKFYDYFLPAVTTNLEKESSSHPYLID